MIEDEMATRGAVENEAVLLQKTDDLAWFGSGKFGHITLISSAKAIKPAVTVGYRKKWKTSERAVFPEVCLTLT
jgi:hypothetical protein